MLQFNMKVYMVFFILFNTEMVKYSNNSILQQAGTSMLSQANQSNQLALSLLG